MSYNFKKSNYTQSYTFLEVKLIEVENEITDSVN
jgi:hypothetical protein